MTVAVAGVIGLLGMLLPKPPPLTRHHAPACCGALDITVSVQVSLECGATQLVSLAAAEDAETVANDLAVQYELSDEQRAALEADLAEQWADGCENAPPIYVGPMCEDNELDECIASIELASAGLVLEVARSTVALGGFGLYIRCLPESESVTLDEGTAVCGYAEGSMRTSPDSAGGKSVAFALASLESVVWFERRLVTVRELLDEGDVDAIAGHLIMLDEDGSVAGIALDPEYDGPRYFVPNEEQPSPLTITALGQMANDLALAEAEAEESSDGAATAATAAAPPPNGPSQLGSEIEAARQARYDEAAIASNLLVLVFRLERDAQMARILLPTRPIATMASSVTFLNDVPMELGCRYGLRYWKNQRDIEALSACLDDSPGASE